jgi:hypothetical protein
MTNLTLSHIDETPNSTVSELMLDGVSICYILEDGFRAVKVKGETRIPVGRYELFARQSGGFWGRYKERFGHDFVIGFKSVPGFTWILFHIGNTIENTGGCLLAGSEYYKPQDDYQVLGSEDAYLKLHELFSEWTKEGPVFIDIGRGCFPEPGEPEEPAEPEEPTEPEEPAEPNPPIEPPIVNPDTDVYAPVGGCAPEAMSIATAVMFIIFLAISLLS